MLDIVGRRADEVNEAHREEAEHHGGHGQLERLLAYRLSLIIVFHYSFMA